MTINEPAVVMEKGYVLGLYAPGHRNAAEAPVVARNLLRAHGHAVQAYRDRGDGCIGIAVNIQPKVPATESQEDKAAAQRAHAWRNLQFLDAILLGSTPDELPVMFGRDWRPLSPEDIALIHQPIDFIGLNYYTRVVVGDDPLTIPLRARMVELEARRTLVGWEIYPGGLTSTLLSLTQRYGNVPIYITECGAAFRDFMDNFEWNSGYTLPYGIVHVDFATQQRTLKSSARFLGEVIRSRGAALDEVRRA
jgi:beta-glucosidase